MRKRTAAGYWIKVSLASAMLIAASPAGMGRAPAFGAGAAETASASGYGGGGEGYGWNRRTIPYGVNDRVELTVPPNESEPNGHDPAPAVPLPSPKGAETSAGGAAAGAGLELEPGCTVSLLDADVWRTGTAGVWVMAVAIVNGSGKDIRLDDYHFRVRTGSGASLKVSLMPENKEALPVLPGETAVYRFYGTGPENLAAEDLTMEIGRWDFSAADYEKPVGALPGGTAAGRSKDGAVDAGGLALAAEAAAIVERNTGKEKEAALTLKLENRSAAPVRLPDWQLWLELKDGGRYSVTVHGLKAGESVPAGTAATASLTVSVPSGKELTGARLIFTRLVPNPDGAGTGAGSSVPVPAGRAALRTDSLAAGAEGPSRSVELSDGVYTLTLDSLQRWPWEEADLLTAAVTVSHGLDTSMPVPALTGLFRSGHAAEWTAGTVLTDTVRTLQPGQQVKLYFQAKISREEPDSGWELTLQETVKGDAAEYKADRASWKELGPDPVKEIGNGRSNSLSCSAGLWSCTVKGMELYEGREDALAVIRVDAVNLEKRYRAPARWAAQLVAKDGTVYPAQVEAADKKVVPLGRSALSVWAPLPYGVEAEGLKLLMGLAVTGGKLSGPGEAPDSFLQAVLYEVPEAPRGQEMKLEAIAMPPYSLKITEVYKPYWYYSKFYFGFNYELAKDLTVNAETKEKRLVVEVLDADRHPVHEEAYALDSTGSSGSASGRILEPGSHRVRWETEINSYSGRLSGYYLRVYEEFRPGYRKLLAESVIE